MEKKVRHFHFLPKKYGKELLIDVGLIKSHKNFLLTKELHSLGFYEIIILTKGAGFAFIDEEKIPISRGTVIFTSPHQVRKWDYSQKPDGYVVLFDGSFIHSFFNDALFLYRFYFFHSSNFMPAIQLDGSLYKQLKAVLGHLISEFGKLEKDSNHFLRAYLYLILILLNRKFSTINSIEEAAPPQTDLFRFRELVETKVYEYNSVNEYAAHLGMSTAFLNKICKDFLHESPAKIIRHRKLLEAKKLLLYTSLTISEISYKLNFSDPANFSRFYSHFTGTSPSEFRMRK